MGSKKFKQVKKKNKFLFFPIYYRNKIYWLQRVLIVKHYTPYGYQISEITKLKR